MGKNTILRVINMMLILSLVASLLSSCTNRTTSRNTTDSSRPLLIPPQSTFIMDFSDFTSNTSAHPWQPPVTISVACLIRAITPTSSPNALGDRANWGFAALNVSFWNLTGLLGLAIPTAAFVESLKQTPVKQPDGAWIGTYSLTVQGTTYTAKLRGTYVTAGVRWEMYISKQNEYIDYLWYYGESSLGSTNGYWVLKDKPAIATDLLRIDWNRNPTAQTGEIKYTNIVPGGSENGGYISFTVAQSQAYDRSYVIYNRGKNESMEIAWNAATKAGRVKDLIHFGDSAWHCWDTSLKDTVSP